MGFGDLGFWGLGFWGFRVLGFLGFSLREHKKCVHIVTASLPVPMSILSFFQIGSETRATKRSDTTSLLVKW